MLISEPPDSAAVRAMYDASRGADGYVANHDHLWAWRPEVDRLFLETRKALGDATSLTMRERAVIVCSTARSLDDAYCSLAWGARLADLASPEAASALLSSGDVSALSPRERALAAWTRKVVKAPNETRAADVDQLRSAGFSDQEIFDATLLVGLRLAFSTVNDALGAQPDRQLAEAAPAPVRAAVTYGRAVAREQSR